MYEPFPIWQICDSSKLNEFEDDDLKFDENCRKLCIQVENTVGNGEFDRYEQLFHSVCKRHVLHTRKNQGLFRKGLNIIINICKARLQ